MDLSKKPEDFPFGPKASEGQRAVGGLGLDKTLGKPSDKTLTSARCPFDVV